MKQGLVVAFLVLGLGCGTGFAADIHEAAASGDLQKVKNLVASDVLVLNAKTSTFVTALDYAAARGHYEVAEFLLGAGANPNIKSDDGKNCLHFLFESSGSAEEKERMFALLASSGADIALRDRKGTSLLHLAAGDGMEKTVTFLIDRGTDPGIKDEAGNTAFHMMALNFSGPAQERIAGLLLARGVDPNAKNEEGMTPLHFLAGNPDPRTGSFTELLLRKGGSFESPDLDGRTPLSIARTLSNVQFTGILNRIASEGPALAASLTAIASAPQQVSTATAVFPATAASHATASTSQQVPAPLTLSESASETASPPTQPEPTPASPPGKTP